MLENKIKPLTWTICCSILLVILSFSCTQKNQKDKVQNVIPKQIVVLPKLDPNTKYDKLGGAHVSRHYIDLNNDSTVKQYLLEIPFQLYFPTDSLGVNRIIQLHLLGFKNNDSLRYFFNGVEMRVDGKFIISKKKYDNSRLVQLIQTPNMTVFKQDSTSGKRVNFTLFDNGTLMVNVKDLLVFMGGNNLTNDTSKFWTFDK